MCEQANMKFLGVIYFLFLSMTLNSQEIKVKSFEETPNDLIARTQEKLDRFFPLIFLGDNIKEHNSLDDVFPYDISEIMLGPENDFERNKVILEQMIDFSKRNGDDGNQIEITRSSYTVKSNDNHNNYI
jgi:hypothetical protein